MNMDDTMNLNGPPLKEDLVSNEERTPEGKAVAEDVDSQSKHSAAVEEELSRKGKPKEDEDESGATSLDLFRIDSGLLPFPEKLMALLDGDQVADAMWWLPDGDAFCLIPPVFAEKVLDKHFQGTKFESFTRKLNRWGFKRVAGQKVPANTIAYYNTHFIRGKPKLLKNMNGGKTKVISAREKRARAQLKRDRDREQAILIAAQQQALYGGDRLNHSSNSLFRPGLSPFGNGSGNVSDQLFAAELAAQKQRELQMQLALASRGSLQGSNPLLQFGSFLQRPSGLTAEQQLMLARSGMSTQNSMAYGSIGTGEESKMNGLFEGQQNNLRAIMAAKASEQQSSQAASMGNMDPQLLMLLQEQQRMKELEILKMNRSL